MGTIIDSLVVTLGLDPKNFTTEQKKIAAGLKEIDQAADGVAKNDAKRQGTKQTERQRIDRTEAKDCADREKREKEALQERAKAEAIAAKKRAEALTVAKEAALGFGAALAAVATDKFILGTAATVAATGRLAHNLDLSTQTVSAFGLAVSQSVGGSADEAIGSLKNLSDALTMLNTGQDKGLLTLFSRLKFYDPKHEIFNTTGPDGKPLSSLDVMNQIAERGPRTDPKNFALALQQSGFSPEVISYLEKGPAFDKKAFDTAYPKAPGDKEAAADQALIAATTELEQSFDQLKRTLTLDFAPTLTRGVGNISAFFDLISQKITLGEYLQQTDKNAHAEAVEKLVLSGKSQADAERQVTIDEASEKPLVTFVGPDPAVAPPGTTEDKAPGFWERTLNMMGIHWFHDNPAAPGGVAAPVKGPGDLPDDVEIEVRKQARARGLDPDRMVALFRQEHGGHTGISPKGAFGPAQLMPGTAKDMGLPTGINQPGYTWQGNAGGGLDYFAKMLKMFNNRYDVAEAAYNAGPGSRGVMHMFATGDRSWLPQQTKDYLASIESMTRTGAAGGKFAGRGGDGVTVHNDTHIGTIVVQTDQRHAAGIAGAIRHEISKGPLVGKAVTGLS